jgi:hypothetical protein
MPISQDDWENSMNALNNAYAPMAIEFVIVNTDTISYRPFAEFANIRFEYFITNAINIYIFDEMPQRGEATYSPDVVEWFNQFMVEDCQISGQYIAIKGENPLYTTLPHEMGHYFDLFHPWEPMLGEPANLTPDDVLYDNPYTWLDQDPTTPEAKSIVTYECDSDIEDHAKLARNYMSAASSNLNAEDCRGEFTSVQQKRIRYSLINRRPDLIKKWLEVNNLYNEENVGGRINLSQSNHSYTATSGNMVVFTPASEGTFTELTLKRSGPMGLSLRHHNWFEQRTVYSFGYSLFLNESPDDIEAHFLPLDEVSIELSHPDAPEPLLHDPWYITNQDENFTQWQQPDDFLPLSEQLNTEGKLDVFLNQGYSLNRWEPPYYSLKTQEKYVGTIDEDQYAFSFSHWSEAEGQFVKVYFESEYETQTEVLFIQNNAQINVNYEPYTRHLASATNPQAATSANRTVVFCEEKLPLNDPDNPNAPVTSIGDWFYMVYQDDDKLYCARSRDGVDWEPEELVISGLSGDANPSVAFYNGPANMYGSPYYVISRLGITWVNAGNYGGTVNYGVYYREKDFVDDSWSGVTTLTTGSVSSGEFISIRPHASFYTGNAIDNRFNRRVFVEYHFNSLKSLSCFTAENNSFDFNYGPTGLISGRDFALSTANPSDRSEAFAMAYFDANRTKVYYLYSDGDTWSNSDKVLVSNTSYPSNINPQNGTIVLDKITSETPVAHIAWQMEHLSFPSWHNKEVYYATVEGTTPANAIVTQKGKFSRIYNYENTLEPSLSIKAVGSDDVSVALGFARNPNKFVYLVQNLQESSRNWQHHSLGAGYRPVLGQQSDNMALWHIPNEDIYPFATTVLPDDGGIAMKSVVRLDYSLSPADNNNREGIISIDLVEVQKNDEKVDIKKNLKSEPLTFSGSNEKLSYAMSIRFINISDNIDPNKVLLSIAAESDEGKIPLSNFKVSELQDASDEQIKSVIKKSRIDNIPLDAGVVVIEPGVMTLMDKSIVFMTDDEIDDILSKASVIEEAYENLIPTQYALDQNYPNPFNPFTTITYALPEQGNVELTVYNSLGQKVKTLVNKHQQAGYHSYIFNGNSVASGIYFYSLKTAKYQQTRKMLLIK